MDELQHLQDLCETGQQRLMATDYLAAEAALVEAEALALAADDFDTLGRLYMPLQEARRQRRQVCGEGVVRLDLWATGPDDVLDGREVAERTQHGQLCVAGWASIDASQAVRKAAEEQRLYVETYLAAVYPMTADGARRLVVIVPTANVALPPAEAGLGGVDRLLSALPPGSLALADDEMPRGPMPGTAATFAQTMALWEQLHLPWLTAARDTPDPRRRVAAYRRCIEVDYACEKAHQWLSETALEIARGA